MASAPLAEPSELTSRIEALAAELAGTAAPVAIDLPSGEGLLVAFYAAARAGRPACLLQRDFAAAERRRALRACCAAHVVGEKGVQAVVDPPRWQVPEDAGDPLFYIGFTSGTSGTPKPFARRWKSWLSSFDQAAELCRVCDRTDVVLAGALQHSHFLFGAALAAERGARTVTVESFDPRELRTKLAGDRAKTLYLVPTMLTMLAERWRDPQPSVRCVVLSGSAQDQHHRTAAHELFPNARIVEIFGASELSFVAVGVDDGGSEATPPLRPFGGVELEIRGAGEIWVRSPFLFSGYVTAEGALDSPLDARGFMTVGDLGRLTAGGELQLTGRASNMVITGGKNVHPEEVEAVLRGHPGVRECVVLGVPHERWGEQLVAVVEPAGDGAGIDPGELAVAVRAQLAGYKVPKQWRTVSRMPRTAGGKVARDVVRCGWIDQQ